MEASKAAGKLTAIEGIEVQELAFDKENKTIYLNNDFKKNKNIPFVILYDNEVDILL